MVRADETADFQHLDEDALTALAQGALTGSELARTERHLAECADCRNALAESVRDAAVALSGPFAISEGELDVPAVGAVLVDKYRVDSELGRGGMGVVLSATHLVLGSRVAIKVLRRPGPSEVARFLREARVSAQLRDPHITRVFDFGQLPSGAPFLVMELLEGRDLAQCLREGPLEIATALRYVLQVCDALAQVHAQGIVHRDLKPANLFLTDDHGRPLIKVLDFGIFKALGSEGLGLESTQLTGQHALIGSPAYMSPEQMRGETVDARSDVWSLGVILYELITGVLPFDERTLSAQAIAVASAEPAPPSRLRPGTPRELERVILHCLCKRPEDRPGDGAALRALLSPLASRATRAPSLAALVALALVLLGGVSWWLSGRAAPGVEAVTAQQSTVSPEPRRPEPRAPEPPAPRASEPPAQPAPPAAEPVELPREVSSPPAHAAPTPDAGARSVRRAGRARAARRERAGAPAVGPTDTPD